MTVPYPPRPGHQPPPHHAVPPVSAHSLAQYGPPPIHPEAPPIMPRKSILTPYVMAWAVLGGCAVGYLGFLAVTAEPQLTAGLGNPADTKFASRLASEVTGLKDSVAKVQLELSRIRTDIAGQDARGKVLSAQLSTLERKIGGSAETTGVEIPAEDTAPAAPSAKTPAAGTQAQTIPSAPPEQPRVVNAEPIALPPEIALETGSVPAPSTATVAKPAKAVTTKTAAAAAGEALDLGTPVVKPAPRTVGVQISSGASLDSLRLSWSLLSDRHADALKNLEARYVARGDEAAPTFDLIAGPIKSKADAQKVCKALAAKNVPCKIGEFMGEAL